MIKLDKDIVSTVTWEQDPDSYDHRLHALGQGQDEFVVVNPAYDPWILNYVDPSTESNPGCVVWAIDNLWLVKKFRHDWNPDSGWKFIHCELDIATIVEYNPDVKFINQALRDKITGYKITIEDLAAEHVWYTEDLVWVARVRADGFDVTGTKNMGTVTPVLEYNPDLPQLNWSLSAPEFHHHDYCYELVWYLDSKFNNEKDKIWVARFKPDSVNGVKDMGYVSPRIEYNYDIPRIDYAQPLTTAYQDLIYEHVWYLDSKYANANEKIWAARIVPIDSQGVKDMGYITPRIEFNPDIPQVEFDSEFLTVYQDLNYEHVWYLDRQFNPMQDDVWLARITPYYSEGVKNMGYVKPLLERNLEIPDVEFELAEVVPYYEFNNNLVWYLDSRFNPTDDRVWALRLHSNNTQAGDKDMGTVSPVFVLNPDVPKELEYYIDDHVPYFDLGYEHVWMLDDSLHRDNERIWAAKIIPNGTSLGVKVVGNIGVKMGNFDVVFISYFEPNAEANWHKLLEVCPTAKRVKNVKGIFEAHKQAAELATTEMFYVVDGDAEILDTWKFDFKPNVFNLDVVHLWTSMNPINGLEYGYGGVKLFPRKLLLDATTWKVDLTTGLGKLIYIPKVSNITAFNTDPFNTWRSAYRECAKLASSLHLNAYNTAETEERLRIWTTVGADKKYGEYALHGANLGKQYGLDNFDKPDELKLINNFEWMKNEFNKFFK